MPGSYKRLNGKYISQTGEENKLTLAGLAHVCSFIPQMCLGCWPLQWTHLWCFTVWEPWACTFGSQGLHNYTRTRGNSLPSPVPFSVFMMYYRPTKITDCIVLIFSANEWKQNALRNKYLFSKVATEDPRNRNNTQNKNIKALTQVSLSRID